MSQLQAHFRRLLRLARVDVHRYPTDDGLGRCIELMRRHGVNLVVDVGASVGDYVRDLRLRGYKGDVLSFEPLSAPFLQLQSRAARDAKWTAQKRAIGNHVGEIQINVAGNRGESSSALPMLARHTDAAPETRYVSVETCEATTLDVAMGDDARFSQRPFFLKIDVQGLEGQVLDGAVRCAEEGRIHGLQIELSLTPLYEGAMPWQDAFSWAERNHLRPVYLRPGFSDSKRELLQFDAFFFRLPA